MPFFWIGKKVVGEKTAFSSAVEKTTSEWLNHGLSACECSQSPPQLVQCSVSSVTVSVIQSRPALCDPMDCSLPGSSVHGDSPGKNTVVGCHALFQGIFPTQGSNPGLHCRRILYHLSYQGSPNESK